MKKHSRDIAKMLLAGYIIVIFQGYFFELAHFLEHMGAYLQNHSTQFHFHHEHAHQHEDFHEHLSLTSISNALVASLDNVLDDMPHPVPPSLNHTIDIHQMVALLNSPIIPYSDFEFIEYYAFSVIEVSPGVKTPPPKA